MKETVLLYNFRDSERLGQVKRALLPLGLRLKLVKKEEYLHPLGYLAGEKIWNRHPKSMKGKNSKRK